MKLLLWCRLIAALPEASFFLLLQMTQVSGLFAAQCDLISRQPVVWLRHLSGLPGPTPRRRLSSHSRLWSLFVALHSPTALSAAQMLLSAAIKGACFPSTLTIWLFLHISPHWSFLAIQNNFWGWLYAGLRQSKLQPCAPKRWESAWWANTQDPGSVAEGTEDSRARSCSSHFTRLISSIHTCSQKS